MLAPLRREVTPAEASIGRSAIIPVPLALCGIGPEPAHVRRWRHGRNTNRSRRDHRTERDAADDRTEIWARDPRSHRSHHDIGATVYIDIAINVDVAVHVPVYTGIPVNVAIDVDIAPAASPRDASATTCPRREVVSSAVVCVGAASATVVVGMANPSTTNVAAMAPKCALIPVIALSLVVSNLIDLPRNT
jgi:hypothetical protein